MSYNPLGESQGRALMRLRLRLLVRRSDDKRIARIPVAAILHIYIRVS